MKSKKTGLCLVLGAGFSVPFGMPTTADLWSCCMEAAPGSTESAVEQAKAHYPLNAFIQRKIHDIELLLTVWLAHDSALEDLRGHRLKLFGEADWDKWKENRLRLLDYLENLQCWVHHNSRGANRSPLSVGLTRFFKEATRRTVRDAPLRIITFYVTRMVWQGTSNGINFWSWDRDLSRSFRKFQATNVGFHLPPIIPTAAGKQYGAFQLALLEEAFNHIASSSTVAIIGYSFPEADQSAQQIIRRALANGGRKRVVYINPYKPSCARDGELLGHVRPEIKDVRWNPTHLFDLL